MSETPKKKPSRSKSSATKKKVAPRKSTAAKKSAAAPKKKASAPRKPKTSVRVASKETHSEPDAPALVEEEVAGIGAFSGSAVAALSDASGDDVQTHDEHDHPPIDYKKIFIWLCILFGISFVGPFTQIKVVILITAFGIALVKAYMVCGYFMHLKFEKHYILYLMATCLLFLFVLFTFIAPDILNKEGANWKLTGEAKIFVPEPEEGSVPAPAPTASDNAFE